MLREHWQHVLTSAPPCINTAAYLTRIGLIFNDQHPEPGEREGAVRLPPVSTLFARVPLRHPPTDSYEWEIYCKRRPLPLSWTLAANCSSMQFHQVTYDGKTQPETAMLPRSVLSLGEASNT